VNNRNEKVAILCLVKPNMADKLWLACFENLSHVMRACGREGYDTTLFLEVSEGDQEIHGQAARGEHIGRIRQRLINRHLRGKKHLINWVFWMDADINGISDFNIIPRLIDVSRRHKAIVAPTILVEPAGDKRWYDTTGFIHNERKASPTLPWMSPHEIGGEPGLWALNGSVGCCYLFPYQLLADDCQYRGHPCWTEHYPFCQDAIARGFKLIWDSTQIVVHARLPWYGERFH
jgi:hypothetical protein